MTYTASNGSKWMICERRESWVKYLLLKSLSFLFEKTQTPMLSSETAPKTYHVYARGWRNPGAIDIMVSWPLYPWTPDVVSISGTPKQPFSEFIGVVLSASRLALIVSGLANQIRAGWTVTVLYFEMMYHASARQRNISDWDWRLDRPENIAYLNIVSGKWWRSRETYEEHQESNLESTRGC